MPCDLPFAVLEAVAIAAAITDAQGVVRFVNPAFTALTGYSNEEIKGQFLAHVQQEGLWRRKSGERFTAEQTVSSVRGTGGEVLYMVVTLLDTTPHNELAHDLHLTKARLKAVEETSGAAVWSWDSISDRIAASNEWLKLHGLNLSDRTVSCEAFAAILPAEDRPEVISFYSAAFKEPKPALSIQYRAVLPDGEIRWIAASTHPGPAIGVCLDVTDRKRVDQLAAEATRDFERFFNLIPDLACIVSTDGYFKKVNSAWETLGYTREEVLRTPMLDFVHPEDLERTIHEASKQGPQYRTKHFVNRYRCKDGSYRLFDWATTFNRDESTRFGVARDVTEQRLWEESLRESEERFRIMADSCPTIIWVTDAEGKIRMTNRTCREFFGFTLENKEEDRPPLSFVHPDDVGEYVEKFRGAIQGRVPFQAEARVKRADGEWRWIVSYGEPRMSLSADFLGHVGLSLDITDRKQTEVALQTAKEAAEIANRSKSEFLANMSHEIRTPMNGVIGLTDLALSTELTAEQREYLLGVKTSAESLLRILNDILDFSKIEAGKLEFEAIEFDLRQTVMSVLKVLGARAAVKDLELACDFAPEVPWRVLGDPGRLQQILVNLTGNAIKFTERGEVVIQVDRSPDASGGLQLHFHVRDTGIGIPPDKQRHVFSPFAQADASSTRKFGGTGLGLSISSQLIEMMRGRIWLVSEEGKGSTFHFTVKLGEPEVQPPKAYAGVEGRGQPILIVDDNDSTRHILDKVLSRAGFATVHARSGSAALQVLRRTAESRDPVRLIVADVQMPGIDGFDLARYIKSDAGLGGLKIVLLTSGIQRGDLERCRELGVACLSKPVGEMELLEAIYTASAPVSTASVRIAEARPEAASRPRLNVLVVEDNAINRVVATRLLTKQNHRVTTACNGREALEMIEKERFDCVLMDVQMPVLDGFETTAAIRSQELGTGLHLPIIAMTAHAMAGDLERCLLAGMDEYLTKPIKVEDVLAAIDRLTQAAGAVA